jgi:hypothetical protein
MEQEGAAFHDRVAAAYLAATGEGVHHLAAGASPDEVLRAAWAQLCRARPETFRARTE